MDDDSEVRTRNSIVGSTEVCREAEEEIKNGSPSTSTIMLMRPIVESLLQPYSAHRVWGVQWRRVCVSMRRVAHMEQSSVSPSCCLWRKNLCLNSWRFPALTWSAGNETVPKNVPPHWHLWLEQIELFFNQSGFILHTPESTERKTLWNELLPLLELAKWCLLAKINCFSHKIRLLVTL